MRICQSKELKDFQNELSQRFRLCCYNGICRLAPTGEEYITFSFNGDTKKEVIAKYKQAIEMYCGVLGSHYTIYWRKYPELQHWPEEGFRIYSRLLISNFPIRDELVQGKKTMQEHNEQAN